MEESKLAALVSALELELHPPHVSYPGVDLSKDIIKCTEIIQDSGALRWVHTPLSTGLQHSRILELYSLYI